MWNGISLKKWLQSLTLCGCNFWPYFVRPKRPVVITFWLVCLSVRLFVFTFWLVCLDIRTYGYTDIKTYRHADWLSVTIHIMLSTSSSSSVAITKKWVLNSSSIAWGHCEQLLLREMSSGFHRVYQTWVWRYFKFLHSRMQMAWTQIG